MYQSLEPEPEGAIFPQRSLPQDMHSSPHDTDASILAETEHTRTCNATPAASLWVEAVHNRNPFIAKRFGSPGNAWARLIPLSRGRMFELGPPHVPRPVCGRGACRSLRKTGTDLGLQCMSFEARSGTAKPVLCRAYRRSPTIQIPVGLWLGVAPQYRLFSGT